MRLMDSAKRPVTSLAGSYGHPVHPALVAVPIGAWIASFVFDVGSRVVSDGRFLVEGSRWLIALGSRGSTAMLVSGWIGALFMILYVTFLGTEGSSWIVRVSRPPAAGATVTVIGRLVASSGLSSASTIAF